MDCYGIVTCLSRNPCVFLCEILGSALSISGEDAILIKYFQCFVYDIIRGENIFCVCVCVGLCE